MKGLDYLNKGLSPLRPLNVPFRETIHYKTYGVARVGPMTMTKSQKPLQN